MVPVLRLVRVERVPSTVKAHHRGDKRIAEHTRLSFERYKLWYWTPRGYVTRIMRYKRKRESCVNTVAGSRGSGAQGAAQDKSDGPGTNP